jgi:phosphonate transport system substrate-binding protein
MDAVSLKRRSRRRWLLAAPSLLASLAIPPAVVRAAERPLIMGVFPRFHLPVKRFMPMADYLGQRIGRRINLVTEKDFAAFWSAVTERRYDIVHYNQYHYIRSANNYEVIAHIEEFGKSMISGAIYVRKDSGFTELSQLRKRTVMFGGGEDAMMSYIVNRYQLLQAGLRQDDFKSLFAVSPPNAVIALSHRQADAAGAGDGILRLQPVMDAVDVGALTTLALSTPLLQLPVAVKRGTPAELREAIQSALIDLKKTDAGRRVLASAMMTGMGKATDSDYDPHRAMVRAVFGSAAPQAAHR